MYISYNAYIFHLDKIQPQICIPRQILTDISTDCLLESALEASTSSSVEILASPLDISNVSGELYTYSFFYFNVYLVNIQSLPFCRLFKNRVN
jgi:hypothetical protein